MTVIEGGGLLDCDTPAGARRQQLILVVEDEPVNRDLLQTMVEDLFGCLAEVAANGPDALALASALRPDVILLDLMMPTMDGFTVARHLKANPQTAHIPIIALTALAGLDDEQAAREAGCSVVIIKPFELDEVERVVQGLLKLDTSPHSAAPQG